MFTSLASKRNGTLYIGATNNLSRRIEQHRSKEFTGFTKSYNVTKRVYYGVFDNINQAIKREKRLKHYNRKWKVDMIEKFNPYWYDLVGDDE